MAKRQPPRRQTGFRRRFRRAVLLTGAFALIVGIGVATLYYREIESSLPPIEAALEYRPPVATQIFASDGTVIGEFFSEKRYVVPLAQIPEHVREGFIAAEDDAFYRHGGVDVFGVARAFVSNLAAGGKVQGGSTITQQVVKSLFLSPQKSYERKIREMLLSRRLEHELSKDQILELYLNHIYLGSGAYGVAAAAREYFGKDVGELDIAEGALLAGLPQAPSRYSPFRHWPRCKARQRYVLNRMYEAGFIDRDTRDAAIRQPLALATRKGSFVAAPYFVEHVRRGLEERYGRGVLYDLGLRVHTTVDLAMQREAQDALRAGLDDLTQRHGDYRNGFRSLEPEAKEIYLRTQQALIGNALEPGQSYEALVVAVRGATARVQVGSVSGELMAEPGGSLPKLALNDLIRVRVVEAVEPAEPAAADAPAAAKPGEGAKFVYDRSPLIEGALIALDPRTGEVKAMVGGYDFERSQFNRVIQAKRQPGSSFKPLVYAAALDRHFTPASVIVDAPVSYSDNGKVWSPQNYEKKFFGPTTLREALTFSRNVVTVKLADAIGVRYLVRYLPRFGLPNKLPPNLSIALGSSEVTPLELATAYSVFANNGVRPKPIFVSEIDDSGGQTIERNQPELVDAIPPETAYLITSMLQDVISRGAGRNAGGLGRAEAGKTGTTNDLQDAWFVGYTPQLLAVVWVGFDSKRPLGNGETGGHVAAPIWKAFMEKALAGVEAREFTVPEGLKCVPVDPATGGHALPGGAVRLECFRPGTEPQPGSVPVAPVVQVATQPHPDEPSSIDFLRNDY